MKKVPTSECITTRSQGVRVGVRGTEPWDRKFDMQAQKDEITNGRQKEVSANLPVAKCFEALNALDCDGEMQITIYRNYKEESSWLKYFVSS